MTEFDDKLISDLRSIVIASISFMLLSTITLIFVTIAELDHLAVMIPIGVGFFWIANRVHGIINRIIFRKNHE